jgi:hypothetical protein
MVAWACLPGGWKTLMSLWSAMPVSAAQSRLRMVSTRPSMVREPQAPSMLQCMRRDAMMADMCAARPSTVDGSPDAAAAARILDKNGRLVKARGLCVKRVV